MSYWIGFDLGGTKMLAALYDAEFNHLARVRRKTRANEGPEAGLARMIEMVDETLTEAGVKREELDGISVASPGPLDLDKGIILEAPNLGWTQVRIRSAFRDAFDCPCFLVNDVDAGVYGEYRFGAGRGSRCVVGIFPGTGIGGGCVYEGNVIRGTSRSCLEIGHLPVVPEGVLCGCGHYGCLETVASRLALSTAALGAAIRGQAPHLVERVGTDLARIRSKALAGSVRDGDRAVERIMRRGAAWIGYAAAGIVNLLAPDVIVLGGGMVEAMPDLFLEEVERAARARVMDSYRDTFKVCVAELSDDAGATGAAAWAQKMSITGDDA